MCTQGLSGPSAVTLTKTVQNTKRDFYWDVYTIYTRSDLINNRDHMHISGTEPT